jgi:hypothetical protein
MEKKEQIIWLDFRNVFEEMYSSNMYKYLKWLYNVYSTKITLIIELWLLDRGPTL